MWQRGILHADINHCYAQIEEVRNPQLKSIPMAVGGHEESRHGIILAKNDLARTYHIKTGESLREAYQKCPHLKIVHPDYACYIRCSEMVKDIYRRYSDKVESFGLDEAWIDVTHSQTLFGNPEKIALRIQQDVYREIGLTVSIGISFNKVFAKVGSDMDKHLGLTSITEENYQDRLWLLPIEDMFYVGRATAVKLRARGIGTIGQLAKTTKDYLNSFLGKPGEMIWYFANGLDSSEVANILEEDPVKSVGNGITTIRDLETMDEVRMVFRVLSESVASRLRELSKKGRVVSIQLRTNTFEYSSKQVKTIDEIDTSDEIMGYVESLLNRLIPLENGVFIKSYRSVSLTVSQLQIDSRKIQLNLFSDENKRVDNRQLDEAIDVLRNKYGFDKVKRCVMLQDTALTSFNPKSDHVIHPVGFF